MFGLKQKYLLLEPSRLETEFYHLPSFVPYSTWEQKKLKQSGFDWEKSVQAMIALIKEGDCEEYKLYKLFIKKWPLYKELNSFIKEKNWRSSEKLINKILQIDLLDPSAYLNYGFVLRSQRKFYQAEQAYLKGLDLISYQTPFLTGLAKTYEELGKFEDAIFAWNKVFELSGNNESLNRLSSLGVYDSESVRLFLDPANNPRVQVASIEEFKSTNSILEDNLHDDVESALSHEDNLKPGPNFERLMCKVFQDSYNDLETLNKLGVKLAHYQYTDLAVKVLDRVYQLSRIQGQEILGPLRN